MKLFSFILFMCFIVLIPVSISAQRQKNTTNNKNYNTSVRYQKGYVRKDGTYVNPHYKTKTNTSNHDNFSTQGNHNQYSGKNGTKAKDYSPNAYNYGKGKTIRTGPRGGQYYINSNGKKTYVPKR